MSLDARMRTIARQEIATAPGPASTDVGELQQQVADLHKELHAVATRVAALEQATAPKTSGTATSEAAPTPRGSRARKATGE